MDRFWSKAERRAPDECWPWLAFTSGGYGIFWFNGKPERSQRVAWTLVNGPIPDGLFVLHRCDVRHCVNPSHLFLGTHADNMADMKAKGRSVCPMKGKSNISARGENGWISKLDDASVRNIRDLVAQGVGHRTLARRYGVDHKTIGAVVHRRTWRHV